MNSLIDLTGNEICVSGYYLALKDVAYRSFIMSEILGKKGLINGKH